jgi:hypothetical protein
MRSAAAAAIVFVVAGGGWGIYSRVQPALLSGARAVPVHVASPGAGFSSAGAMRTPQTLNGPVVPAPAATAKPAGVTGRTPAKPGQMAVKHSKADTKKNAAQPAAPTVQ